ncbi:glycosyltransferase family 4 protein [Haloarcula sp. CBA1127]|uniref:glycosyltransferase family 4 protein n=1 Tax=Haloarcula sp. CBA1127 TaxID=1765055 RepID=UPI0018963F6C|nr:glycosyltransferase family 4 protein [Haloarcula sp. CBA1127]
MVSHEYPPYILGGISYHLENLYNEIAELGHEITIIAGKCIESKNKNKYGTNSNITVERLFYPSIRGYHLQFPSLVYRKLKNIDTMKYDVLLTHLDLPFSVNIPKITKKHDCRHISRRFMKREQSKPVNLLDKLINPTRQWVSQKSLKTSDHIVYNSSLTKKLWEDKYPIECSTNVIYNGVDTDVFEPKTKEDVESDYLLFVGNEERKGKSKIIDFSESSEYPIYIVGPDDIDAPNIKALGRLSQRNLAKYYRNAIATLHPANFEAFGNVILESLACGTPVVVSDNCGAAEIIDDSCGRITEDLHTGVEEVKNLDQDNCVKIAESYSWENVAKETIASVNKCSHR